MFVVVFSLFLIIVSLAIGIGIGYAIYDGKDDDKDVVTKETTTAPISAKQQEDRYMKHKQILDDMDNKNIEKNLK